MNYRRRKFAGKVILLCAILASSVFFTVYSEVTAKSAFDALKLCASSVIPSLFPFMVLSAMASRAASHLTGKGSARAAVILPVFLGALCGFPVGAACTASMYKNGAISKNKAEHLCALCNNTGPAFVIDVIGRTFWGSSKIGIMFYICQLLSAALIFSAWRIIFGKNAVETPCPFDGSVKVCVSSANSCGPVDTFCRGFCSSVGESALSVVQICGYIVFFKVICDIAHYLLPGGNASDIIYAALSSVLEFTSGSAAAAELGGAAGIAFCGFAIGFSGLSVMAQSTGLLSKAGMSASPLLKMKVFSGAACAMLSLAAYRLCNFPEPVSTGAQISSYTVSPALTMIILAAAIPAFAAIALRSPSKK